MAEERRTRESESERERERYRHRHRQHCHRAPPQPSSEAAARPQFNDGSQQDYGCRHRERDDRDRLTNLVTWSLSESVCHGQRHPPEEYRLRNRLFVRAIAYRLLHKLTVLRCRNRGWLWTLDTRSGR